MISEPGNRRGSAVVVDSLTKRFRGVTALQDVSLRIDQDAILGVIGPNGAGKSTLFGLMTGLLQPTAGSITMNGTEIAGLPTHKVAPLGLVKTFQDARLFAGQGLTVRDNVMIGGYHKQRSGLLSAGLRTRRSRSELAAARERADELLELVGLRSHADADPSSLSYGERRRVEIARALAADPTILLLDEPSAGLNPAETEKLGATLHELWTRGIGLAVVDHDIPFIMNLVHEVVVLAWGNVIARGKPEEVRQFEHVRDAYFGGAA